MIVRSAEDIEGSENDWRWSAGLTRRLLLERDGMGFTVTDTTVEAGTSSPLHYRDHLEACYCIEGRGEVECEGVVHPIAPGTIYALDRHDAHVLRAHTDMRLICVFNPALEGGEKPGRSEEW